MHIGPHGLSQKASDADVLPICHYHHTRDDVSLHAIGRRYFEDLYGLNLLELCGMFAARPRIAIIGTVYVVGFSDCENPQYIGSVEKCLKAARSWENLPVWLFKRAREIRREQILAMRESKAA